MIAEVINIINHQLVCCMPRGSRLYSLAQLMARPQVGTDAVQTLPAVVDKYGEGTYVGIDDTFPLQLYHRMLTLSVSYPPASGYGDATADTTNTFGMLMVVYMNLKRVDMTVDEMVLSLQGLLGFSKPVRPYKLITVRVTGAQLVGSTVFAQEYQNTGDRIPPGAALFSISYQVEARFTSGCIMEDCKLIKMSEINLDKSKYVLTERDNFIQIE